MNFLAHLALAGPSDISRIGNLLGDFEKGTPASLRERLPEEIVAGILMHRQIDAYTDSHPLFKEARNLLAPSRRRFAGIVVDIFFDHFLTIHWNRYHPGTLSAFIAEVYAAFDAHPHLLGKQLGPLIPRIREENWLASYRTEAGLALTLQRVSSRSPRLSPLVDSMTDFSENREEFEECFLAFYPQIRAKSASLLGLKLKETPHYP